MTTVIKNGTIVTHDLTYKADVLIEGGRIAEIGENLSGDETLDATGCYVMPGGIDPHTHLEMPFMGTYSSDDFESGTRAALVRRHHDGRGLRAAIARPGPARRARHVAQQVDPRELRLFLPHGDHLVGRAGLRRDEDHRRAGGHHQLQALHGLQGRADGERRRDVRQLPPPGRARRHRPGPCRERRRGRRAAAQADGRGQYRPRGPRLFAAARSRGRGDEPRDHDRRHGRRAALRRPYLLRGGARGDPPRPPAGQAGLGRAADPAPDARRGRVFRPRTGTMPPAA